MISCMKQDNVHVKHKWHFKLKAAGLILGMGSANERQCYIVRSFLIGRAYSQNDL